MEVHLFICRLECLVYPGRKFILFLLCPIPGRQNTIARYYYWRNHFLYPFECLACAWGNIGAQVLASSLFTDRYLSGSDRLQHYEI